MLSPFPSDRDDQPVSSPAAPGDGSNGSSVSPDVEPDGDDSSLSASAFGSGLLSRQPTPDPESLAAVPKVCPQCGTEYETGSRFCVKDGAALRPKAGSDPLVGRVIAERYLVLAPLGQGGMGRVYLAEHLKINRQCAIKVMNPSLVNDHDSATRFAREASNAAQILHPNVAAVFDFGESDRVVFLVMEYVDGEPLSRILEREGTLPPRRAVDIACQIAEGLSAAHELGIVHRDLKPDNVIVAHTRAGKDLPKIVDFGIAKAASEAPQDALTRSGLVIGTPEYMSPEQLLGDPIDARSDIYSLGCILYQMLTGASAFADETREQMIRRRLHEPPPSVRDIIPDLPRRLDATLSHMLARSPADRLPTAVEARAALNPALVFQRWAAQGGAGQSPARSAPSAQPAPGDGKRTAAPSPTSAPTKIIDRAQDGDGDASLQPTVRIPIQLPRQMPRARRFGAGTATLVLSVLGLAGVGLHYWRQQQQQAVTPAVANKDTTTAPLVAPETTQAGRGGAQTQPTPTDTGRVAAKRQTDSTEKALLDAAVKALHQPLEELKKAIGSADINRVHAIWPEAPSTWKDFFDKMEKSSATANYEKETYTNDKAELNFTIFLKHQTHGETTSSTTPYKFHAVLRRDSGKWVIDDLKLNAS